MRKDEKIDYTAIECPVCHEVKNWERFNAKGPPFTICSACALIQDQKRHADAKEARRVERLRANPESGLSRADKRRLAQKKKVDKLVARKKRENGSALRAEAARKFKEAVLPTPPKREPTAAEKEMAWRILAQRRLLPFIMRFKEDYLAGWVHRDICSRLEKFSDDVIAGKSPRLMLFLPPRTGKSEIASVNFPAWHLGRCPKHEIIATSYAAALAFSFSKRVRGIIRDPAYTSVFKGTQLDPDSQSTENWNTTAGGGYLAAGVGGPITGRGAHILIVDDPVKNQEEADSETAREVTANWYSSTAYTRLAPGGGVLIIMTRWNEADLAGWQLEMQKQGGDKWEVVSYPAVATEDEQYRRKGEALHPERYNIDLLNQIKKAVGPRNWSALYQQNPVAEAGVYFTDKMLKYYDGAPPSGLRYYTAWDLAISEKERADWTVGTTIGVDANDVWYIVDQRRGHWDAHRIVEEILDVYTKYRSSVTGIEKGHVQLAIGPFLKKRIKERKLYSMYVLEFGAGRRDKAARARPIQGRMEQGMVRFPRHAPYMESLRNELLGFQGGAKHDDQVDSLAWLGMMIDEILPAQGLKNKKTKSWRDKLTRLGYRNKNYHSAMSA